MRRNILSIMKVLTYLEASDDVADTGLETTTAPICCEQEFTVDSVLPTL